MTPTSPHSRLGDQWSPLRSERTSRSKHTEARRPTNSPSQNERTERRNDATATPTSGFPELAEAVRNARVPNRESSAVNRVAGNTVIPYHHREFDIESGFVRVVLDVTVGDAPPVACCRQPVGQVAAGVKMKHRRVPNGERESTTH
jgi:hypothetical protein